MKKTSLLVLFMFFGVISSSQASEIDFRLAPFSAANNQTSYFYNQAGLTITPLPTDATLYQDSVDGLGVRHSYEYDEIEADETLWLHFNTPQWLNSILISDLFNEPYNAGGGSFQEEGSYSFDLISWTGIMADSGQTPPGTNGELKIEFTEPPVITDIYFQALGWRNKVSDVWLEDHEYSVAVIDVTPVPVPGAIMLLGSGLLGLAGFRKKFVK